MDINFKRQILNDFSISEEEFDRGRNIFVVNNPDDRFLFYNKSLLMIIIFDNRIFLRSNDYKLIGALKKRIHEISWPVVYRIPQYKKAGKYIN